MEYDSTLLVFIHLLGVGVSVHALFFGRTAEGTIAWVLGLIFLPYLALPLYFIFGHQRFRGYIKVRRQGANELSPWAVKINKLTKPYRVELPSHLKSLQRLNAIGPYDFTDKNEVKLLKNGDTTFAELFDQIKKAEHYLLVQFYIIRDDELGQKFKAEVISAVNRGVKVFLLYDEIGSHRLSNRYLNELERSGVRLSRFNTLYKRNRFQINFRNHRKLCIRDGKAAMLGGHNLGNEYLGQGVEFNHWRDTHLIFSGPSVITAQLAFFEDWYWATDEQLDLQWDNSDWQCISDTVSTQMLVLPTGPADEMESCSLAFVELINSAKFSLMIVSPYFVPDRKVLGAIQLAALRGVKVKILMPEYSDDWLVKLSSLSFIEEVEPCGVEIYLYEYGLLHQKVLLIDEEVSVITTANLDNRSLKINFEIGAVIASPPFGQQVLEMLNQDFLHSRRITSEEINSWPWFKLLAMRIARLFAPIQ